jgi:hypothetical protein
MANGLTAFVDYPGTILGAAAPPSSVLFLQLSAAASRQDWGRLRTGGFCRRADGCGHSGCHCQRPKCARKLLSVLGLGTLPTFWRDRGNNTSELPTAIIALARAEKTMGSSSAISTAVLRASCAAGPRSASLGKAPLDRSSEISIGSYAASSIRGRSKSGLRRACC